MLYYHLFIVLTYSDYITFHLALGSLVLGAEDFAGYSFSGGAKRIVSGVAKLTLAHDHYDWIAP